MKPTVAPADEPMSVEAQEAWFAEAERELQAFVMFVNRWPQYRLHVAYAQLGSAIASVDMMGGDADRFIVELRKRSPKPAPLVPPEKH